MLIIFITFTVIITLSLISVSILSLSDILSCDDDQGVGSVVMLVIELPLIVLTYVFSSRTKKNIVKLTSMNQMNGKS